MNSIEIEENVPLTVDRMFVRTGTVTHQNYRRTWTSSDYRLLCGKYKGKQLSQVVNQKYLLWLLNFFENQLDSELFTALKDQFNEQFR